MKIEMMIIGALFFGLIFTVGLNIYGESLSNYNTEVDTSTDFGKIGNSVKSIYDYQSGMKDKIQGGEVTDEEAVDQMLKGGYTSIRNAPFGALTAASNATMMIAKETGFVDSPFITFFITVLSILILFAIIALIFKFEQR